MDELFDTVVGCMNFIPSGPADEDMRDGRLAASPTQDLDCLIWEAFAARGIGGVANGRVKGGGSVDEIYGWATTGVGLPQSDLGT